MKSIIIPAYNAAYTIAPCISALKEQLYSDDEYEIIVVDDGSTDETAAIAKAEGVQVISISNGGPARARNKGVREAKGDIVLFTDADCIPLSNWLTEMVRPFADERIAGVMGRYISRQKTVSARFAQMEFEERYARYERRVFIDVIATYSAAFRREIFLREGGFNESFPKADNEDVELSYRLSRAGYSMVFSPQAVVIHRHPESVIAYCRQKYGRAYWRMVTYQLHPSKAVSDSYTPSSLKFQVVLAPIITLLPFLSFAKRELLSLALIGILVFILSSVRLFKLALKKDSKLILFLPWLLYLRAFSLGIGISKFLINNLCSKLKNE